MFSGTKKPNLLRTQTCVVSSVRLSHSTICRWRRDWVPQTETIDERDRRKRVQISLRFEDADKDRNGRIDMQELRGLLESSCRDTVQQHLMQHWLSDAEVARLIARYDLDNSGDLEEQEFEQLVIDGLLLDEKLADYQAVFDAVDADRSGDISAKELSLALQRLGWPQSNEQEARKLIERYGSNAAGNLEFRGFMALMRDTQLDVSEVLAYVGARPPSPSTSRAVIHAVANPSFHHITGGQDLEFRLAAVGESRLVLLMAGTTWCRSSRAMVDKLKALAEAYPSVMVLLLWGNVNIQTKELFRDILKVRSTPAFFMFKGNELLCHWAGSDVMHLEQQLRRRVDTEAAPSQPIFTDPRATVEDDEDD